MRSTAWSVVLLLLVFAVGWTARSVVGGAAPEDVPAAAERDGTGRGRPDGRRGGPFGRFLDSVRQFSVELALSPEQESSLQALFDETLAEIRVHETRIGEVMEEARPRLRAILTDAQRARLDELVDERFRRRSEQKVARTVAWAREAFGLDDERAARLEEALETYEDGKRALFAARGGAEEEAPPTREERAERMDELRAALEARLDGVLDEAQRDELLRRSRGRHSVGAGRDLVE